LRRLAHEFLQERRGPAAAEFALVALLFITMSLGVIDMARLAWELNSAKAATRAGARLAVVSRPVSDDLNGFDAIAELGIPGGQPVPANSALDRTCTADGCSAGGADAATFTAIVARMRDFYGQTDPDDVTVTYRHEGLGYSGLIGPAVEPLVTVTIAARPFTPTALQIFGVSFSLPAVSTTMTGEDLA